MKPNNLVVLTLVKFPHSPILHHAFSSWIEKTTTKKIHCQLGKQICLTIVWGYAEILPWPLPTQNHSFLRNLTPFSKNSFVLFYEFLIKLKKNIWLRSRAVIVMLQYIMMYLLVRPAVRKVLLNNFRLTITIRLHKSPPLILLKLVSLPRSRIGYLTAVNVEWRSNKVAHWIEIESRFKKIFFDPNYQINHFPESN